MSTDRVRLRDVLHADADLLDSWDTPAISGAFNDFGMPRGKARPKILATSPDGPGMSDAV